MSQATVQIADRSIGDNHSPMIIAEMSGNHNRSLDRALAIVDAAAGAGADAIKLQTYTADTMTLDVDGPGFCIEDPDSLWNGRKLHDLYDEAHTPWQWHAAIFERARERGILAFSSPFDESAVDFLESLDVPAYKIASFELTHLPLVRKVAQTGKPLIMSTGMATLTEIQQSLETACDAGAKQIILLKCTSSYPADPTDSHLRTISDMREKLGVQIGLSDHTMGVGASVAAVALGATVIEKHFTLDRSEGGVDSQFSLEPDELRQLVTETKRAWQSLGRVSYGAIGKQQASLAFRQSIYVCDDVAAGTEVTSDHLRIVRPGFGLPPKDWDRVIGKVANRDLRRGEPTDWKMFAA